MVARKSTGCPRARHTRVAFTLIELLVVIAIIALLISILLPSLESAREQSKQSACLSHLKGIATSSRVYESDDPSGWGIPCHPMQYQQIRKKPIFVGAYEWGGKSGIGWPGFVPGPVDGPDAYISSKYGTKAGFGPSTRPMNDILYPGGFKDFRYPEYDRLGALADTKLDLAIYKCPADDGPPRGAHCLMWSAHADRPSYDHFGTSYSSNVFMISYVGGGVIRSNSPYLRPISRIPNSARTLYYEENIGRWAWACRREQCDFIQPGIDPGVTKAIRGWHGKNWMFNRAFVDGHGEMHKVLIEGTEDPEGYYLHYRNEIIYGNSQDEEDLQQAHRCIIVRGNGWQKDTLPAEPIETGLIWSGGARPSDEDCAAALRE
ncbi:MAG: prepilin-type N-terminal cleavage/methylation domain-containing protein [Planctomycetota bacterium]